MDLSDYHNRLAIQAEDLCFSYHKEAKPAISQLSLSIPRGASFGLLGQNGAGKSTTLKLLTGLLKAQSGYVQLLGKDLNQHRPYIFSELGVLIEEPPLYPHLSGYDNLKISSLYRNLSDTRIGEVLEMVGLSDASDKKTGRYSTGMKQRLGIGLALLADPQLLILDEPINGMDPQGIVAVRHLIQHLHQQGKTILLSSHLLHEVELTCDHVGIIRQGKLLYQGTVSALKKQSQSKQRVWITTSDVALSVRSLQQYHIEDQSPDGFWIYPANQKQVTEVIDVLRKQGIDINQITPEEQNLERLYLQLTTPQKEVDDV